MVDVPADVVKTVAALVERGQFADAISLARQALDGGAEAPLLLNLRAYWLEGQNRSLEALVDLERATKLAPDDPPILNALGLCLAKLGRTGEAREAFRSCAALAPGFAPAHFNCGWTSEELGELEEARLSFEAAARANPASAAGAWAHLASLAARRGQWVEARSLAERSIAQDPTQTTAILALANADLAEKALPAAKKRLEDLISTASVGARERGTALGLLGDVLDAQGEYKEAFAAYTQGNAHFKAMFAQHFAVRAEMAMREYVRLLLDRFKREKAETWRAQEQSPSTGARRHVFVLGFPRSGTTLLEEILACHPQTVTTGEKDAMFDIVRELFASDRQIERLKSLDANTLATYRAKYMDELRKFGIDANGKVLVDKQPFNSIRLPLIAKLFPDAMIIFCVRDPRDVVLSCFRRRFTFNAANAEFLTLEGAARLYDDVMQLYRLCVPMCGLATLSLRNEDLISNFDAEIRAICDFLGIAWTDEFRQFGARSKTREITTPSATQIQKGLDRQGVGHWHNYAEQLKPVLPLLGGWAEAFGYVRN